MKHVRFELLLEICFVRLYSLFLYNISLAIQAHASASSSSLFISLIDQVHYHLHHHILLFSLALGNHQRKSNESVISYTLGAVFTIEDVVVVEEPEEEGGGNALVSFLLNCQEFLDCCLI